MRAKRPEHANAYAHIASNQDIRGSFTPQKFLSGWTASWACRLVPCRGKSPRWKAELQIPAWSTDLAETSLLTEAGEIVRQSLQTVVDDVRSVEQLASELQKEPHGVLRVPLAIDFWASLRCADIAGIRGTISGNPARFPSIGRRRQPPGGSCRESTSGSADRQIPRIWCARSHRAIRYSALLPAYFSSDTELPLAARGD